MSPRLLAGAVLARIGRQVREARYAWHMRAYARQLDAEEGHARFWTDEHPNQ